MAVQFKKEDGRARQMTSFIHIPILAEEITELLVRDANGIYLDGTLGLGGHSGHIIKRLGAGGKVIGLDKDAEAIKMARENVNDERLKTFNLSYTEAPKALALAGESGVDGALFDLGLSSYQLDDAQRGFSFLRQGPLDMRFDGRGELRAYDIVNKYSADKLTDIFENYGEERQASKIALAICMARRESPIETTTALAALIEKTVGRGGKIHPATRVFQALRIAVNDELACVKAAPYVAKDILKVGGRAAFLTFHSTEDRIIKQAFKEIVSSGDYKLVNKKVIEPSWEEIKKNPRARSAKLRVMERVK